MCTTDQTQTTGDTTSGGDSPPTRTRQSSRRSSPKGPTTKEMFEAIMASNGMMSDKLARLVAILEGRATPVPSGGQTIGFELQQHLREALGDENLEVLVIRAADLNLGARTPSDENVAAAQAATGIDPDVIAELSTRVGAIETRLDSLTDGMDPDESVTDAIDRVFSERETELASRVAERAAQHTDQVAEAVRTEFADADEQVRQDFATADAQLRRDLESQISTARTEAVASATAWFRDSMRGVLGRFLGVWGVLTIVAWLFMWALVNDWESGSDKGLMIFVVGTAIAGLIAALITLFGDGIGAFASASARASSNNGGNSGQNGGPQPPARPTAPTPVAPAPAANPTPPPAGGSGSQAGAQTPPANPAQGAQASASAAAAA